MLLEAQAKQNEPVEARQNKEPVNSVKREEGKGDAIAAALALTLEDFSNDFGQWGEMDTDI